MLFLIQTYQLVIPALIRNLLRKFKNKIIENLKKLISHLLNFLYLPLAFCLRSFGFIFPNFQYLNRIGHLACEPDIFLKEFLLKGKSYRSPVILLKTSVANELLLRFWEKYYVVIKNRILVILLSPLLQHPLTRFDTKKYVVAMNQTAQAFSIQSQWADRPPLLEVSKELKKEGDLILKKLGVEAGRWYVCMHARSPHYSPLDESYNNFRNFNFENFNLAVRWIHNHGGVCIRMGDSKINRVKDVPGLIDYAVCDFKEDWIDIYLAATCRFFVGSASGLYAVAVVFGRPVALVNLAPFSMALPLRKGDIGIPKLYKDVKSGRLLRFNEIISMGAANYRFSENFKDADIELLDNSPEDILGLVIEQYNRTMGCYVQTDQDFYLQNTFNSIFKNGDYCYGSSANIGSDFLRKYKDLLK